MIKRLNDELGMTILISSHILSELYLVANPFGIVDQGRLIKEISKAEFEEQRRRLHHPQDKSASPCGSTDPGSTPSPHQGHR